MDNGSTIAENPGENFDAGMLLGGNLEDRIGDWDVVSLGRR